MGNGIEIPLTFPFFLSFLLLSTPPISALQYPINVWPKPTTYTWPHPQATLISPNITISSPSHQYLVPAVKRYFDQIFSEHYRPLVTPKLNLTSSLPLDAFIIEVDDVTSPLTHGVNESYSLNIPAPYESTTVTLRAQTVWGAMRGLESFSQLVYGNPARAASALYIQDQPLYMHRGVMLDTSRNYFPVEDLLRLIGAMSMNKLNVFHWHITDSHSFPLFLPSEPKLAQKGAYGEDMMYSVEDVKRIVKYGMEHGVRVIPEIDMPAHTGSWAYAYPDIVSCASKFWWPADADWTDRFASEPGTGQLNPLNPNTYEVVKNVIRDVATMFPDSFYHAGADEIIPNCWKSDPAIQTFLANNGTLSQVLEIFVNSTLPSILAQNRTVVYWEDVMLDVTISVSPSVLPQENIILQTWNNGPNNTKKDSFLWLPSHCFIFRLLLLGLWTWRFPGKCSQYSQPPGIDPRNGGSWCGPFKTWETIYNYDITYGLTEEEAKLVIGGEVALWSEQADSTVLDPRIWPRTSAMAETLWSGNRDDTGMKRYAEATDRLNEWRYRMVTRGIAAEPIQPLWCIRNPGMCNTVHPFV